METQTFEDQLIRHALFLELSEEFVRRLAAASEPRHVREGQMVLRYGDPATHLFLLVEGHVTLELHTPQGGAIVIQTLGPGSVLGWSWLLEPHRWRFDARARDDVRLIAIDAETLRSACEAEPSVGYLVLKRMVAALGQRLEAARLQLMDLYGR